MALDLAEFLICIEEEFNIKIKDNDSLFEGEFEVRASLQKSNFLFRRCRNILAVMAMFIIVMLFSGFCS